MPAAIFRDPPNAVLCKVAQVPAVITSTTTSSALDMSTGDGRCVCTVITGAVSGTTPTATVKVQQSATSGGTYADITGATTAALSAANTVTRFSFDRDLPFLRVVNTEAGTSPSFAIAIFIEESLKMV